MGNCMRESLFSRVVKDDSTVLAGLIRIFLLFVCSAVSCFVFISSLILYPAAATIQTNFTASTMHDNPTIARDTGMVDDGTGKKVVCLLPNVTEQLFVTYE